MGLESSIERVISYLPTKVQEPLMAFALRQIETLRLIYCTLYDFQLYRKSWGGKSPNDKGALEAQIIKTYHNIEKGLALPAPRLGFGKEAISSLVKNTNKYIKLYGPDTTTRSVINALKNYVQYNKSNGVDTSKLEKELQALEKKQGEVTNHCCGGTIEKTREEIHAASKIDFASFLKSRHSVRNFSKEPVALETIEKAIALAQKAPSVCNRQSGCAFVIQKGKAMDGLLSLQGGNRGFTSHIDKIIVVTSKVDTFLHAIERHQHWIDGGLFGMSLVYALHSLGLGSCCLHWDVSPPKDKKAKSIIKIPDNHAIIMLIAVGNIPEKLLVAESPRKNFEDVCFIR